jgi:RNA recognition motif-containing protein
VSKAHGMMNTRVSSAHLYHVMSTNDLDSAYVFVGGLAYDLSEGDVVTIMSQYVYTPRIPTNKRYGEVMDINMPRDPETGKPKGFCFLMYEDQRSTVLAVDNLTGAQVLGRTIRVSPLSTKYLVCNWPDERSTIVRSTSRRDLRMKMGIM